MCSGLSLFNHPVTQNAINAEPKTDASLKYELYATLGLEVLVRD